MEALLDPHIATAQYAIGALLLLRLIEYGRARRNAEMLLADGAREVALDAHARLAILHGVWLFAITYVAVANRTLWEPAAIAFVPVLALRLWTVAKHGAGWSLRLFRPPPPVLPAAKRALGAATIAEFAVLPFAFGAWWLAAIFVPAGAWVLRDRARIEARLLAGPSDSD
ncbi:MAG: hypothetical protein ACKOEE_02180 [Tagaea sp.]